MNLSTIFLSMVLLAVSPYDESIVAAAREQGIAPEVALSVAWVESRYDPGVRSPTGAVGLFQVTPAAARDVGYEVGVAQLYDPRLNIAVGVAYLRRLLDRFTAMPSRGCGPLPLALAGYNVGIGTLLRHRDRLAEVVCGRQSMAAGAAYYRRVARNVADEFGVAMDKLDFRPKETKR